MPDEPRKAADAGAASFDPQVFAGIAAIFPAERVQKHLASFDHQLATAFVGGEDREHLQTVSHKLITQAGMLGFLELSELCRELEETAENGAAIAVPLNRVRAAASRAREKVAQLQAEIQAPDQS